jgi:carotenoid cleavage dioxygenase-like enzyme
MPEYNFADGFKSQKQEFTIDSLPIEGQAPSWLKGSLIRTGPALFELEHDSYNHWFDGLAMLHKFSFQNGKVGYANRFLKSDSYCKAMENGKISIKEFATDPCRTLFQKVKSYFIAPALTDNGNISIIRYGEELLATTETPLPILFDQQTLESLGHFEYEDELEGQIEPAHPHYSPDGAVYNYLLKYGLRSKYQVYKMDAGGRTRELITSIHAPNPSYMHSIGMTENYIILVEFPKIVNPLELKFGDKPLIANYHWKPDLGTKYRVIDKSSGECMTYEGYPVFAFHHVNAYETEHNTIVIDFVAFEDASVLDELYLDKVRSEEPSPVSGHLTRATIRLSEKHHVNLQRLSDKLIELPRINYERVNMKPYQYVYGAGTTVEGNFLDDVTKIDVKNGESWKWHRTGCYPGEPVFVAHPQAEAEDEGVLLSIVLDTEANETFLLILDAQTMEEVGRSVVPAVIPFNFHGAFKNH